MTSNRGGWEVFCVQFLLIFYFCHQHYLVFFPQNSSLNLPNRFPKCLAIIPSKATFCGLFQTFLKFHYDCSHNNIWTFINFYQRHQVTKPTLLHLHTQTTKKVSEFFPIFAVLRFWNNKLKREKQITNIEFKKNLTNENKTENKNKKIIWIIKSRELNRVQLSIDSVIGHKWVPTKKKYK